MVKFDGASIPQNVVDQLYEIRRQLCWLSARLPDTAYVEELNRVGMAMNLGVLADELDGVMHNLGLPSWHGGDFDHVDADRYWADLEIRLLKTHRARKFSRRDA